MSIDLDLVVSEFLKTNGTSKLKADLCSQKLFPFTQLLAEKDPGLQNALALLGCKTTIGTETSQTQGTAQVDLIHRKSFDSLFTQASDFTSNFFENLSRGKSPVASAPPKPRQPVKTDRTDDESLK